MLRRRGPGTPADLLVVGLGNPGEEYEHTRHNVGADVVRLLARRHGARLRRYRYQAVTGEGRVDGHRLALAIPLTYVNDSGAAVAPLVRRYGVGPERIVVVHDELDLPVAALRVKVGGGLAGHRGLRSIERALGTSGFLRVRIGIEKPPSRDRGADHVLDRFGKRERQEIDVALERAADAVEMILTDGVQAAMTRFNQRVS